MIFTIIVRNLLYKPLGSFLSWVLLLFGVAIISLILSMQQQLHQRFVNDIADIDMVVGAKGSPLQLVLSTVYRADLPTGNIKESELEKIIADPMIEEVIPLAFGDNYKGFSITGTDSSYLRKYKAIIAQGKIFQHPMEAVVGSSVAEQAGLMLGNEFLGSHGQAEKGPVHEGHPYRITGILAPTGSVIDNLILTNVETVHMIHDDHNDEKDEHVKEKGHSEVESGIGIKTDKPGNEENHEKEGENHDEEITAALIKFRSPMAMMTFPRIINQTSSIMAASPVLEMNRLMNLMGIGSTVIQYIAYAVIAIAMLSIFISLMNRLHERLYEMALLRSLGYSSFRLFLIITGEGMLLIVSGFLAGLVASRIGLYLLNQNVAKGYHLHFKIWQISSDEWNVLFGMLMAGFIAGAIPAIKVWKLNISKTLANA